MSVHVAPDTLREVALRRVVVIGAGLIGTSIALALGERGADVRLTDRDPAAVRLAVRLGAGRELTEPAEPADLAVLAVPPHHVAAALKTAQRRCLAAAFTDVASVKSGPLARAEDLGCDLTTYVPGHPLAGRERSGPAAARADLFLGRPWALCPTAQTTSPALAAAVALARACGAEPVILDAAEHDQAVALTSHAPHVVAAATAARLVGAGEVALTLSGQGLRDATRIAAGDPRLWQEILSLNAGPVAAVLAAIAADLTAVAGALDRLAAGEETDGQIVSDLLSRGNTGRARIPGKHGGRASRYAVVPVVIPDRPGELARLFQAAGDAGVNIEDVAIEHSPGLPLGVAELAVKPEAADHLTAELRRQGWSVP